jgi:hypothetical protein
MDLFIQPNVTFEKTAALVELPEDPNTWPKEILDELFKQVPYIADFRPHVVMTKVDPERLYGLGHVEISNESEAQMGTDPAMLQAAGVRTVRIPIVIRDGKLSPFDLLVNDQSKVMPLTESRLRQAIFRPQAFDVTSQTPGDQSMIGQLYPPYRQNFGFGGGGVSVPAMGMGKTGSALEELLIADLEAKDAGFRKPKEKTSAAKPVVEFKKTSSVLQSILPTIDAVELDGFWKAIEADVGLQAQFRKNAQASSLLLGLLAQHEPMTAEKMASVLPSYIKPTVVQIARDAVGYTVKAASHHYWRPFTQRIDRGELVQRFGEKIALAVDSSGAVTMADGAAAAEAPPIEQSAPILEYGLYKVRTEDGAELVGHVIPNLLDTDGGPLPLSLFTDGSHSTVQSEIHGEPAGEGGGQTLSTGPVSGMGAFFYVEQGGVCATIPMSLSGSFQDEQEPTTFVGETFDGRPVQVSVQPNIQKPVGTGDGKLLIPQNWQWMPLDNTKSVALVGSEENFGNPDDEKPVTDVKQASACVEIRSSGDCFSFCGRPVEKLAYEEREMIDLDAAMFLLAGLGVEQGYGTTKLAHAMTNAQPEVVKIGRLLTTAEDANQEAFDAAVGKLAHVPNLKQNLVKEASVIPDPMAVDTVLSLGFINPENLMTFVSYLPTLDDSQMKMCELLLAVRLGLANVPESALERAVRSTEEAIEGLKIIAFSE